MECKISPSQSNQEAKHVLEETMNENGIAKFLCERLSPDVLRELNTVMGLPSADESTKPMELADEIMLGGMEDWLWGFPRNLLESWCKDLTISFSADLSDDILKDKIMAHIFSLEPLSLPSPPQKEEQDTEESETKGSNGSEKDSNSRGTKRKNESMERDQDDNSVQTPKKKNTRKI